MACSGTEKWRNGFELDSVDSRWSPEQGCCDDNDKTPGFKIVHFLINLTINWVRGADNS
jgi:hypothetical protein